ncbi:MULTISPECIES: BMP family lipoprotein [Streptomyces]|uniref:BMP family lipoprotein n=1 Tax=Streptomyces TaxID=1883 RepID=UPI00116508B6|nr:MULTISPECIES: BMP family ABC transporter substrate-binding protein [Streptomyces]MCX4611309.1 BMP family ABC transporter substrate-binding protein [Streptomyces mirabilis]MCX5351531.1 BMP family ABC transporter substrate-binding protein [Streptomyces mirabilis]NMI60506.1 BMP family ABC transporter substrate-binding protein [Streptomyces sp. RLA2-12]QDN59662.1 BMP family ABC transporter substrate-binding protein [Streptomyces sp. S1D4-20]QDN69740.1 BMP family ABC transporter substrate-bindin
MRRVSRIAVAGVATASLAVALSACGGSSTSASSGGSAKTKGIGLAYDIGGKGDQSFNDAAYAGFQKAETDLKMSGRDIEPQDGESDADKVQRLEQLAKSGYNPVIGVGFVYAPAIKEVAAKYPKITFGIIDDEQDKAANVADMVFHEEQASYLAGVAAAKATKKNHIGFVGGVDIPLIHKFEAGYVQGAQSVNPKIKIEKQYLTQTPQEGGFSSPDKGKDAAEGQIEAGADVIYAAAGLSGQGVIQSAASHKVWAIGVDSDQYKQDALAKYKDYILTSATKDVAGAVYNLAKSVADGKPATGVVRASLATGGVGLADSNPAFKNNADLQAALKKAEAGIKDGSITVKTS